MLDKVLRIIACGMAGYGLSANSIPIILISIFAILYLIELNTANIKGD